MRAVGKVLQALLGVMFLGAGGQKLAGADSMVDQFARFRYPQWFRVATGAIEVTGALGMLAGLRRPVLVPVAGVLLSGTMVGAIASHLRADDPARQRGRPMMLLILIAIAAMPRTRQPDVLARDSADV